MNRIDKLIFKARAAAASDLELGTALIEQDVSIIIDDLG